MAKQKKTLLELMVEAGIQWPEGAEYAAQDKRSCTGINQICFYSAKPKRFFCEDYWLGERSEVGNRLVLPELCHNWHQTIVTREQYESAVAEQSEQSETTEPQFCEPIPTKTIEQRISQLQVMERNAAEFRAKLTDDLHALGLTWREGAVVADEPKAEPEQPVITDWRDLLVGDVVEFEGVSGHWPVLGIENDDCEDNAPIKVSESIKAECLVDGWVKLDVHPFRFIRRP